MGESDYGLEATCERSTIIIVDTSTISHAPPGFLEKLKVKMDITGKFYSTEGINRELLQYYRQYYKNSRTNGNDAGFSLDCIAELYFIRQKVPVLKFDGEQAGNLSRLENYFKWLFDMYDINAVDYSIIISAVNAAVYGSKAAVFSTDNDLLYAGKSIRQEMFRKSGSPGPHQMPVFRKVPRREL